MGTSTIAVGITSSARVEILVDESDTDGSLAARRRDSFDRSLA
jgi:hypothetical protein